MHEASIAASLLDTVSRHCAKSGYARIDSINVKIGRASGIMPDALIFAFNALKYGTPAGEAVLNVEEVPVSGHCDGCASGFLVEEDFVLSCPLCGGSQFRITSGRELDIIDMEVS